MTPNHFHLHIADDDADLRTGLRILLREMFALITESDAPSSVMDALKKQSPDVLLLDLNFARGRNDGIEGKDLLRELHQQFPDISVVILTAWAGIDLAVECMKLGAVDFVTKPWDNLRLEATLLAALRVAMLRQETSALRKQAFVTPKQRLTNGILAADSVLMKQLMERVDKVVVTDAAVLINGENGCGKSLLAQEMHHRSARSDASFLVADLGSIAPSLFDDTLFGHEKGAYTDANEARPGLFELADGGTLFLDEIGNIPLPLQAKLLTALGSGAVTRLGSNATRLVDVRIIAGSTVDLNDRVRQGLFREDLLFRINTISLQVPPLRNRHDDFDSLIGYFNRLYASRYQKTPLLFGIKLVNRMKLYSWPGNVRELAHAIERAIILSDGASVDESLLIPAVDQFAKSTQNHTLDNAERNAIVKALRSTGGNLQAASKLLGIGRTTLYRKIEKYGI